MSARRVLWLLLAGALVIGFAIWLSSQRHLERATLAGDVVLPGLEHAVNAVTQVRLVRGDQTHATLVRQGPDFMVAERDWPADRGRVRRLLLDLGTLNVVEEKTRLPANFPQLGVEDVTSAKATGTRVEVTSPARKWALIVGKAAGAKSGYVRVAEAPQSLLAQPALSVDADPRSWLSRALLDVVPERVREIEEHPAQGAAFTASRAKAEQNDFTVAPLPKGRELSSPGAADSLAAALSALSLDDVSKAAAAPPPSAHAVFRTFDGLEVTVSGRKEGSRALISLAAQGSGSAAADAQQLNAKLGGWEFRVPDYKYAAIFTSLDDLLKPLPAPAAKPARPAKP
ncbi:MAG: DUF4340 domain-containing protein [Proteobacteria bacterium]|nr:DUF4340 domain-containing protein [Pseudomonadota bacterium]